MTGDSRFSKDDEANAAHFGMKVAKHDKGHLAVDWGSRRSQQLRFQKLKEMLSIRDGNSIIDVGCGLAGFLDYLNDRQINVDYTGIDVSEEMISRCRSRYPNNDFLTGSFLNLGKIKADLVVASGIFNLRTNHPFDFLQETVLRMYESCNRRIAFNCLSSRAENKEPGEFHVDPEKVLDMCQQLEGDVVLDHSYLPHDFTIAIKKPS
ncbi:MAG: class I SAM-dependent methyltransferase [Phycisphaerales bacterium]|nr:class I SAM-dependent methyltransferase [Phycisphaerales bacterium]|tara:strand:- start:1449 stop:2069 length:621 start_codon:yes stop_codon:yes gene_type:complete